VWQSRNATGIEEFSPREHLLSTATELRNLAFLHEVWIGERGVNAVRTFIDALAAEKIRAGQDDSLLESAMLALKSALTRDLGFKPE